VRVVRDRDGRLGGGEEGGRGGRDVRRDADQSIGVNERCGGVRCEDEDSLPYQREWHAGAHAGDGAH